MKLKFLFILTLITLSPVHAIDSQKCSAMLNNGMWKKYKYGGIGEAKLKACTQGTKQDGTSTATSDASTESTTMVVDTKYSTNVTKSQTQSTSSFGACSAFANVDQLKKDREVYIAQNEHEVLIDMARGSGEHLKVITFYSACAPEAYPELSSSLQKSISGKGQIPDIKTLCLDIDQIIAKNPSLKDKCFGEI